MRSLTLHESDQVSAGIDILEVLVISGLVAAGSLGPVLAYCMESTDLGIYCMTSASGMLAYISFWQVIMRP